MSAALLESVGIPCGKSDTKEWYNVQLVEKLLQILYSSCQYGSRIRIITLDVAVGVIKQLVINEGKSFLADNHFAEIEGIKEESTLLLRKFYRSEEIFLDMFEDEYRESIKSMTKIEVVLSDASLLLPPTGTPLTGIDFTKRLPCGEVERARKAIRTFFRFRQLSLDVQGLEETFLPLSSPDSCVQVHDVLDLNNSDLLAVNVISTANSAITIGHDGGSSKLPKHRLFLVVDIYQIVLVEPDTKRLGWGVAIFAGFLQDLEVVSDKEDSRCLHVTVHGPKNALRSGRPAFSSPSSSPMGGAGSRKRVNNKSSPLLSATFTFDDHIRCMAAKQRLTKGRAKARQRKMHQIAQLLDLPGNVGPSCPSPPALNLHSLRKEAAAHRRSRNTSEGRNSNTASPRHAVQHFGGMSLTNQQPQAATKSAGRSVLAKIPSLGFSSRPPVSTYQDDSEGTSSRSSGSIRQQAVSKLSSATDHLDSRGLGRTGGSSPARGRTASFKRIPSCAEEMEIGAIAMTDYSSSPKSEGIMMGVQTNSLEEGMVTDSRDDLHFSEEKTSVRENPFNSKDKL